MMPRTGAETTVTVSRPDPTAEPYTTITQTLIVTGLVGLIVTPSGSDRALGGDQEVIVAVLLADPANIRNNDRVTDAYDGAEYRVVWVAHRHGLGVDHVKAGLIRWTGVESG